MINENLNHEATKSRRSNRVPEIASCLRAFVVSFVLLSIGCQSPRIENLKTLGAIGDGKTPCTQILQKALFACAISGGEVVVPAGEYLIGSVVMGSNTTLRLEK